jgi:signal transduction histidine kinase/ActR/RegA family two-component response regulator
VIVEDIDRDPLWAACKQGVLSMGLRACWSTPILARDGVVLGTFGIYYLEPRRPTPDQLELADRMSHLAAIALERQRADLSIQLMHEQLEELIRMRTQQLEHAVHELIQAREAAEAASAAKSVFLASVSHEIRTPLNAVLGFAQLLASSADLKPAHAEGARAIQGGAEHLLTLINDVLEMSKIESGHVNIVHGAFAVRPLLEQLACMFRLPAQQKGLELQLRIAPDLPGAIVSDQGKLRQVLINLIGNAIKFSERGAIQIRVWSESNAGADKARIVFEVQDSGAGIAPQHHAEIFEPFMQAGNDLQRAGGTGLGLAISKRFVERLGGSIGVQSELGRGSTFRFDVLADLAQAQAAQATRATSGTRLLTSGPILVVDDSALNRRLMREILEPLGFMVIEAQDGREALACYAQHRPALVLMDMRMPVMDGREAMRRIRREHGDKVRMVAVTASVFEEEVPEIMASGADEVLHKPFRNEHLLSIVERQLQLTQPLPRG